MRPEIIDFVKRFRKPGSTLLPGGWEPQEKEPATVQQPVKRFGGEDFSADVRTGESEQKRGGIDVMGAIIGAMAGFAGGPDAVLNLARQKQARIENEAEREAKAREWVAAMREREQARADQMDRDAADRASREKISADSLEAARMAREEARQDRLSMFQATQADKKEAREQAAKTRREENEAKQESENKPKQIPAAQVATISEGAAVLRMLPSIRETIEKNSGVFGPVMGRLRAANPYDMRSNTVDSEMRSASQAFGRYMEGGVLRKEDEAKYRKMFPQTGDTPEVASNKLKIVENVLRKNYGDRLQALRKSNWDTTGLESLLQEDQDTAGGPVKAATGASGLTPDARRARIAELKAKLGK